MARFIPVTLSHRRTSCSGRPPKFDGRAAAVQWAVAQGALRVDEACQRYDELCKTYTGVNVYPFWIREVGRALWNTQPIYVRGDGG